MPSHRRSTCAAAHHFTTTRLRFGEVSNAHRSGVEPGITPAEIDDEIFFSIVPLGVVNAFDEAYRVEDLLCSLMVSVMLH